MQDGRRGSENRLVDAGTEVSPEEASVLGRKTTLVRQVVLVWFVGLLVVWFVALAVARTLLGP